MLSLDAVDDELQKLGVRCERNNGKERLFTSSLSPRPMSRRALVQAMGTRLEVSQ